LHHPDQHKEFQTALAPNAPAINENAIVTRLVASKKNYLFIKRFFDVVLSLVGIVFLLSWIFPIIALLIKFGSKGPVVFTQKRMGRYGKTFRCFKFRTMFVNEEADERQAEENDERITRIGKFLRKSNIDELPQLLNVLLGDMSLVGPRPHMLSDCTRFSFVVSAYPFRSLVKPGITGLAQIKGYRGPAKDYESIVNRYYWDAVYIRKASLWLDAKIAGQTIAHCLKNLSKRQR